MKLTARKDMTLDDDYVDVKYRTLTPAIHQIFQLCENTSSVLMCEKDGTTYKVDVNDVLYVEAVDRKSCVCTQDDVFTISTPLSQLEETLTEQHFIRVNNMTLVNIYKIKSLSNGLHYKLTAQLENGEDLIVSRHYRSALSNAIQTLIKEEMAK